MFSYFKNRQEGQAKSKKGKLLAEAVEKANNPDTPNRDYWVHLAEKMASDETVPTNYVPVRQIITSLKQGNLTLANELYNRPESNNELEKRAGDLISQLVRVSANNTIKIAQIEEAGHWLNIVMSIIIAKAGRIEEGLYIVKRDLREEVEKNLALKGVGSEEIEKMIDFIASTPFDTRENVQKVIPLFKQIVPVHHRGAIFETVERTAKGMANLVREINKEFPIDVVPDNKGHISIWKTMGLEEDSYKDFMGLSKGPNSRPEYDHFEANALLFNEPVEEAKHRDAFDLITRFKEEGGGYSFVVIKLLERNYEVPEYLIRRIYYEGREVLKEEYKGNLERSKEATSDLEEDKNDNTSPEINDAMQQVLLNNQETNNIQQAVPNDQDAQQIIPHNSSEDEVTMGLAGNLL